MTCHEPECVRPGSYGEIHQEPGVEALWLIVVKFRCSLSCLVTSLGAVRYEYILAHCSKILFV